jgi:hypothetical protein
MVDDYIKESLFELVPGDLVVDLIDGDIGVLIERYEVLPANTYDSGFVTEPIYGWRIHWTGIDMKESNRQTPITESGLANIIKNGRAKLIKK